MTTKTSTDPVSLLSSTTASDAVLAVWLGQTDTPHAFWPTDDHEACQEAVAEWIRRDPDAIFTAQDDDHGTENDDDRVARYMSAIAIEPVGDSAKTYTLSDGDGVETITALDDADAREQAEAWARSGDWDTSNGTVWIDVRIEDEDGDSERITVAIDPEEPACSGRGVDHDWQSPHEVVGGLQENPGVRGHGGGVIVREVCATCGAYKVTDTWAQRSDTGEQGLRSVSYADADEESLAWIASEDEGAESEE